MPFLKFPISIMRCDFKSSSCFSSVFGYPGFAVVGELGSDDAMLSWFLLVMILHLPFAIQFSLVLACLAVSDFGLSVLQAVYMYSLDSFSLCAHRYVGSPGKPALLCSQASLYSKLPECAWFSRKCQEMVSSLWQTQQDSATAERANTLCACSQMP